MKKRLLVFITSLCLIFASSVPAFADVDKVSDDQDVQAAYEAYVAMTDAMYSSGDYAAMVKASDDLTQNTTILDENDAKSEEWQNIITDKVGIDKFLNDVFNLAFTMLVFEKEIEGEAGLIEAYKTAPDLNKAYELVDMYKILEEDNVLMDQLAASIDAADPSRQVCSTYALAEEQVENISPDVISVYEAYVLVNDAVSGPWPGEFDEAISEFEKVIDTFNDGLDDNEKADLAALIGASDWEEAYNMILGDWININVGSEMAKLYDAYDQNPTKANAKAFVDYYDSIYNDPNYEDEDLRDFINECFSDLESKYQEAKELLSGGSSEGENGTAVSEPEDNNGKSPDTGDDMNVLPFAVIMVLAAAGAAVAVRRRA